MHDKTTPSLPLWPDWKDACTAALSLSRRHTAKIYPVLPHKRIFTDHEVSQLIHIFWDRAGKSIIPQTPEARNALRARILEIVPWWIESPAAN